jgi:hypothetical protein
MVVPVFSLSLYVEGIYSADYSRPQTPYYPSRQRISPTLGIRKAKIQSPLSQYELDRGRSVYVCETEGSIVHCPTIGSIR